METFCDRVFGALVNEETKWEDLDGELSDDSMTNSDESTYISTSKSRRVACGSTVHA